MSSEDYFWKAFKATGSPQIYLLYSSYKKNQIKHNNDERRKRNAGL